MARLATSFRRGFRPSQKRSPVAHGHHSVGDPAVAESAKVEDDLASRVGRVATAIRLARNRGPGAYRAETSRPSVVMAFCWFDALAVDKRQAAVDQVGEGQARDAARLTARLTE
jgi:hypothetical protein